MTEEEFYALRPGERVLYTPTPVKNVYGELTKESQPQECVVIGYETLSAAGSLKLLSTDKMSFGPNIAPYLKAIVPEREEIHDIIGYDESILRRDV
jgi:hypothetical protein